MIRKPWTIVTRYVVITPNNHLFLQVAVSQAPRRESDADSFTGLEAGLAEYLKLSCSRRSMNERGSARQRAAGKAEQEREEFIKHAPKPVSLENRYNFPILQPHNTIFPVTKGLTT